jgi:hypothetical protein
MFIKQPPLTMSVSVKVFRDKRDGKGVGSYYSQIPLGPIYRWYPMTAPSLEVVWQCAESTVGLSSLIEISYDQITPELYDTLKAFYIGKKPEKIFRGSAGLRDNS